MFNFSEYNLLKKNNNFNKKFNNKKFNKKKNRKRLFKIIGYPHEGKNYGNFVGRYPAQAAHKALNILAKKINMTNSNIHNQMKFWLKDTSTNKEYCYVGSRIKLNKPTVIYRNNKKIEYWYKTILRRCREQEHEIKLN